MLPTPPPRPATPPPLHVENVPQVTLQESARECTLTLPVFRHALSSLLRFFGILSIIFPNSLPHSLRGFFFSFIIYFFFGALVRQCSTILDVWRCIWTYIDIFWNDLRIFGCIQVTWDFGATFDCFVYFDISGEFFFLLLLFEFVHDIWRFFAVPCGSLIFEVFLEFLWEILCDSCDADSCDYSHRHFKILLTSFQDELWDNFRFILRTWRLFWGFSRDSRGSILIFGGISRFFWDSLATSAPLYVENVPQVT